MLTNVLDYFTRLWLQNREFRIALKELESSSDRQLHELGLTRADIVSVAYEEAERRMAERAHKLAAAKASARPAAQSGASARTALQVR